MEEHKSNELIREPNDRDGTQRLAQPDGSGQSHGKRGERRNAGERETRADGGNRQDRRPDQASPARCFRQIGGGGETNGISRGTHFPGPFSDGGRCDVSSRSPPPRAGRTPP